MHHEFYIKNNKNLTKLEEIKNVQPDIKTVIDNYQRDYNKQKQTQNLEYSVK